ncbi:acyl carrier protein [Dechloromonas denitrificans]|uniref:acyl carrier protein n=1 Tax=Dechloromonas denitrificans TaxID=281362 RepID=UPI000A61D438|nr:acyl carrier protein [Dechloromonas denitrificans]
MYLEQGLNTENEVLSLLDEILSLNGRSAEFSLNTPLLGAIPELDSMAVVALITSFEDRFGFTVDDDEIEGSTFATLGSLIAFVDAKLAS